MEFTHFKALVSEIKGGKQLPDAIYLHESAIAFVPDALATVTLKIADALKIPEEQWNVVKYNKRDYKISFLHYPDFEAYAYPALHESFTVNVADATMRKANYSTSKNPPILHRKEHFVANDYPLYERFITHTEAGEALGLYENPRIIGFRQQWERLIKSKGHYLDDEGTLKPLSDKSLMNEQNNDVIVERHRTAIDRKQLSQPAQILARHNYFNGDYSFLDYGCGKGDDLRELEAHGINACGWDPVHSPEGQLIRSDIVNLGFVLNVIESKQERDETLVRAWSYADKLLVVSVMIGSDNLISQFKPYKDGVITSRNTFQKYYSQGEFRFYLENTLNENIVAVGQGVFIIFKDKQEEQLFFLERQHVKRSWQKKTQREIKEREPTLKKDIIDKHIALFTDFWHCSLHLGRTPSNDEFEFSDQLRRVAGSHNKAHQALINHFGVELFDEAAAKRRDDLLVYFALSLFEKRKTQSKMPSSLRRDIKVFFNSYTAAINEARELLFSVGDPAIIQKACEEAYKQFNCGEMNEGHSYIFHKDLLSEAPKVLRVYIGCATQLYGDLEEIQLIKAHIRSGKVSLMRYEGWDSDAPQLAERIKIKMRKQDVDFFDYVNVDSKNHSVVKALFS